MREVEHKLRSLLGEYQKSRVKAWSRYSEWEKNAHRLASDLSTFTTGSGQSDVKLLYASSGTGHARTLQLSIVGDEALDHAGNKVQEYGAQLLISQRQNGMIRFEYLPGSLGERSTETLFFGDEEPNKALDALDKYLEMFLTHARDLHWSRVSEATALLGAR